MKKYDLIVVGAGSATSIAIKSAMQGLKTALIEELQPGGTCLNRGCIPTKIMLQSADIGEYIKTSSMYGIESNIKKVNLNKIKKRVNDIVGNWRDRLNKTLDKTKNLDFYNYKTKFIGEKLLEVNGKKLFGKKIILAVGMRPFIPNIPGLNKVKYLTNRNIFSLKKIPKSIGIIGGGYIGMEFAHFFGALGSKVYIIEMKDKLLSELEPSLSDKFNEFVKDKYQIHINTALKKIEKKNGKTVLFCEHKRKKIRLTTDEILISVGRISNADTLDLNKTGVKTDERNFIKTNTCFTTDNPDIYASGDCLGTPAFRHIAGYQARLLTRNLLKNKKECPDYTIVPNAVFTHPEIASVGMTYENAIKKYKNVISKKLNYFGTAKGQAMGINGFSKAIIDADSEKILGFHIIGPNASILIHEVIPVMTAGLSYKKIVEAIHIHPAFSELVIWTFTEGK